MAQLHHNYCKIGNTAQNEEMEMHERSSSATVDDVSVPLQPTSTFGSHCSTNTKTNIDAWFNALPPTAEMDDVSAPRAMTSELYKDWLDWAKQKALTWVQRLDRLERYFRKAALKYHKLPYHARHSVIHNDVKLIPLVLRRLSEILETDQPCTQQSYFNSWFEIMGLAATILDELKRHQPLTDDLGTLRLMVCQFDVCLARIPKLYHTATASMEWLRDAVNDVAARIQVDGSEALAQKYSREGGLIRRWMLTLTEVENGKVEERAEYIEWYVDRLLDVGVEYDSYWTMLVLTSPARREE
jgi:hypothetical protein